MIRHININFFNSVANFLKKRTFELIGLSLISLATILLISFITYSPNDPSLVYGQEKTIIQNFFGIYGSLISDFLLQSFGLMSFLLLITITSWGLKLIIKKEFKKIILKNFFVVLYLIFGCTFIYTTFNNSFWLIDNGNSGFVGQIIFDNLDKEIKILENRYVKFIFFILTFIFLF